MVFSRRTLGAAALVAAAALTLGGCATSSDDSTSDGPVTLEWWTWWGAAPAYADAWNAENPDIQVVVSNVGIGEEQTAKLLAAVRAGEGPDLALAEYQTVPSYVVSGIALDITEYVGDTKDAFSDQVWGLVTLEGATFGVPLDIGPMVLFYRPDKFEEFGLEVPTTWEEYRAVGEKLKAADPDAYLNVFSPIDAGKFAGLSQQAGSEWWSVSGGAWGVDIDSAASAQVADYWDGLISDELVSAQPWWTPEFYKLIGDGDVISFPAGAWLGGKNFVNNVSPEHEGLWRAAPLPVWEEGDPTGFMGGSTAVVTTTSEHPEESAAFLRWLGATSEGNAVLAAEGNYPASSVGQEALRDQPVAPGRIVTGQEDFHEILYQTMQNMADVTWGPNAVTTYTAFRDEFGRAVESGSGLASTLSTIQKITLDDLASSGFTLIE